MFTARLHQRVAELGTRVCLGLDPRPEFHASADRSLASVATVPASDRTEATVRAITAYFESLLDATHDLIACCKPQSAFFEALGLPGLEALAAVIAHAKDLEVPVLLDAKRGDIDSTAAAYACAYLTDGALGADALTINPYLGMDALEPFVTAARDNDKGVFVLLKTSNLGSADLQDVQLASGVPLYQHLAGLLNERTTRLPVDDHGYSPLGVVVGATHAGHLAALRGVLPRSVFLVPGYGAQGGTAEDVVAAFDRDGFGAVISASRSVNYPFGPVAESAEVAVDASRAAVRTMRDQINSALERR